MIKKKRKIRIPAAVTGGTNTPVGIPGVNGAQNPPVPPINGASIEAVSGAQQSAAPAGNVAQMVGGAVGLVGNTVAAAKGEMNTGQAALGGLAAGASLGAAFGPLGAGIGALAGATIGTITSGLSGGKTAEMTSFTEFDEGKLAGFLRPGRRSAQKKELKRVRQNAYANRAAVEGTGQLQANYNEEYGQMDTNTFAYGGSTNSLAYVDDGELISTPDGQISKVPELGRPTDSNLVSLPEGSRILSDKLKVPGTNKTFAQLGEEMMTTKKSKFNDKYAENAAKLNEMNNKSIHDQLFEIQEMVKAKKGIKRKYKDAVIAADTGDEVPYYLRRPEDIPTDPPYMVSWGQGAPKIEVQPVQQGSAQQPVKPKSRISPQVKQWSYGDNFKYLKDGKYDDNYLNFINNVLTQDMIDEAIKNNPQSFARFRASNPNYTPTLADARKWATDYKPSDFHRFAEYLYDTYSGATPLKLSPSDWIQETPADRALAAEDLKRYPLYNKIKVTPTKEDKEEEQDENKPDITGLITSAASSLAGLAPILSNLNTKPEYQDPNYNPYARAIMTTMRNRRFDIAPAMRDIERNRAITNYNAAQMNTNTGANLAFRLQNASNANRAIADIRSQESNVNNTYLGEYANMLNNLGQQWAAETTRVDDANMANRAQARNIRRAGLSGLSQWFQNRELMRNQRDRDNAMLALYEPFLEAGFTTQDMTKFRNWLRRTNG